MLLSLGQKCATLYDDLARRSSRDVVVEAEGIPGTSKTSLVSCR